VQIAQLQNPKPGEIAREIGDRHGDADHARPPGEDDAQQREKRGCAHDRQRDAGGVGQSQQIGRAEKHDEQ